jgi:hypothetical protein
MAHPPPQVSHADNSLRFTDILFGFVIKELFVRLASLPDGYVFAHLCSITALVLGSWIGYRLSLNRSQYEVKFFNLPLMKFTVDQGMLIYYFRLAVMTSTDSSQQHPSGASLLELNLQGVCVVFLLYALWDLLGIWMAKSKDDHRPFRYPKIKNGSMSTEPSLADWDALWITCEFLVVFVFMYLAGSRVPPLVGFWALAGFLVLYRFFKQLRTTLRED